MSSTGGPQPLLYFCYQCNRTVSTAPSPTSELICPNCNDGFLEEYEDPVINTNPNPNPNLNSFASDNLSGFPSFSDGFPIGFSSSTLAGGEGGGGFQLQNHSDLSALFGGRSQQGQGSYAGEFNPFAFLENYINNLRAGGANIQLVIENSSDPTGGFGFPANLGDYFVGPGLEQLIQQLADNDPNRYGTPPASKSAVEALPNIMISDQLLGSDSSQCAVCKDSFELGEAVKQMPCRHIYHSDCILPWLEIHNSCPVCRYEMPTDDPDYENRTTPGSLVPGAQGLAEADGISTAAAASGASQENSPTPRMTERRYRITLPWPFRALSSPAETSNSGSGNNSGSNDGDLNPEGQAREEDLD